MDNKRGALFLRTLVILGLFWGVVGFLWVSLYFDREAAFGFIRVFFFTCLDLFAMVMIFWKLFFSGLSGIAKKVDLSLWFVFKLVCLVFLAITLKRLTNAPFAAILLGVGFIGVGPIAAGIICKGLAKDRF